MMMIHVRYEDEGDKVHEHTIKAALSKIPAEVDIGELSAAMGDFSPVTVQTMDGRVATMWFVDDTKTTTDEQQQEELFEYGVKTTSTDSDLKYPVLALAPLPMELHHAQVAMFPQLDIDIAVNCVDTKHGEDIIDDVLSGRRNPPAGFKILLDVEKLKDFIRGLQRLVFDNDVSVLGTVSHTTQTWFDPEPMRQLVYEEKP